MNKIYTIGFSKKNLKDFVKRLQCASVRKVIDVRLNNTSQLAGYAKKEDLEFVLGLLNITYVHIPELAPTDSILKDYKKKIIKWNDYENEFNKLLTERNLEYAFGELSKDGPVCLLCSEDKPTQCHRRLVAEFFQKRKPDIIVQHI